MAKVTGDPDMVGLKKAAGLMRGALEILDDVGGADEVGCHLDLALSRLTEKIDGGIPDCAWPIAGEPEDLARTSCMVEPGFTGGV